MQQNSFHNSQVHTGNFHTSISDFTDCRGIVMEKQLFDFEMNERFFFTSSHFILQFYGIKNS